MPIQIQCTGCGKQYQAQAHLAGKKIRCRQCGTVFVIPGLLDLPDPEPEPDDALNRLAAMEQSFGGDSTIITHSPSPDLPIPEDIPISIGSSFRHNSRLTYPGAAVVDRWLPIVLLVGGVIWIALTAFNINADKPALAAARLGVLFCTYLALIFPMGLKGMHLAGRDLGFHLPRTSTWRALATFMPMFALGAVMWMVGEGSTTALVIGLVAGFVISAGAMWLLFRLQTNEVPAAAGYAGGMVALAVGIAAGVLFGLNALLSSALVSLHKQDALAGSPFGVGFTWPKPAGPETTPQTTIAKTTPAPAPAPAPTPEPTPVPQPNNVAMAPTPAPAPAPAPMPAPNQSSGTQTTALFSPDKKVVGEKPPLFQDPELGNTPLFNGNVSPLVESAALAPIEDSFTSILHPARPSPWAVLLRKASDMGQMDRIWVGPGDPPAGIAPWKPVASVPYVPESQAADKYALSPNGELLAHVSKFPALSVLVYSFKEKRVVQTLKLQENFGDAEVFEFFSDDRLLVHRSKNGLDGFEIWDVKGGSRNKAFDTPRLTGDWVKPAISPDGTMFAVVAPDTTRNGDITLFIYELPLATLRKLAITDLGANNNSRATGLAFSTDSTKIGVLFEQNPNGLLVVFRSKGMVKPVLSQPLLPVPAHPDGVFNGSSITWLTDDALLLYGRVIIGSATGAALADLGTGGAASQMFSKPDICELDLPGQRPEHGIALVKLKMADIAKMK